VDAFVARHRSLVTSALSGFDRLVFRGTLLSLVRPFGMYRFLTSAGVLLVDFKQYVEATTARLKAVASAEATRLDRPVRYLPSSREDKEDLARELLAEQPVDEGLICHFRTLEPCMTFEYHRSSDRRERGLRLVPGKCLHLYKYYLHPLFGFMGARLQTWFPFNVQIWINGREWLARDLTRRGRTDFRRDDNCFTQLGDPKLAQRLMDRQLTLRWPLVLDRIARDLNPLHNETFKSWPQSYYWSAYQSEWATDLLFRDPASLASIYPPLVRHAMLHFHSPDVMRFLGRKVHGNFTGQVITSFKRRPEGVRVKHWVNGNSIKMYDKAGNILRIETTVANPKDFKVLRPHHNRPKGRLEWRPLRKGVADLHRRSQVSNRANARYLDALATVEDSTPLHEILDAVSRPTSYHGRQVRALRIGDAADINLLQAITRGEFAVAGFRNRDLRPILQPRRQSGRDLARRLAARVGRQIRLLRAHGLVRKVPKSHRYLLTDKGHQLAAALFAARGANIKRLLDLAA
jgi:hypothetical protein